jgi:hypothetical protein
VGKPKKSARNNLPHQWKPGQSGNPAGAPPRSPEEFSLQKACRELAPEALEVICEIMRAPKAKFQVRLRAAQFLIERGFGAIPPSEEGLLDPDEYGAAAREAMQQMNERTIGGKLQ